MNNRHRQKTTENRHPQTTATNPLSVQLAELASVAESPFSQLAQGHIAKSQLTNAQLDDAQFSESITASSNPSTTSSTTFSTTSSTKKTNTTNTKWQRLIGLPAYYWILIAMVVVITPHLQYMPVWLVIYALFSVVMQLPKIKAKFNQPTNKYLRLKPLYRTVQLLAFVLGVVGLWYRFLGFTVESAVGFLLLCLASKLWEMYHRRDAFVVLNLSLFVCASLFLLDQGLSNSLLALFAVLTVLMAFIAINDNDNDKGTGRVRSLFMLLGLALPLMVVLFLFFPRLPPLWSLKLSSPQATTGMSDTMSPGDFANLSQSTELAFRVEFTEGLPSRQDMYWRGLVFSDFDGKTWSVHNPNITANKQLQSNQLFPWNEGQQPPPWLIEAINSMGNVNGRQRLAKNYQVTLEPTNQRWLFALDYPTTVGKNRELTPNFTLNTWQPITVQHRYQASYKPTMHINQRLSDYERQINLALPPTGNERSRQLAQQLYQQAGSTQAYINAIMTWINQSNFRYTLSPPTLGKQRIDEFLFNTQAGFCEHYSSSFTYLMRSAGIPARVVVGYQGGELGRDGSSWEVRQMDAHAWSEVWIEGSGWVRVDPTSFVAPERVEKGMDELTNEQGSAMFGDGMVAQLSYQQFKMLQQLRRFSDQMSYYWKRDIVGYDQDSQSQSLFKWFNIKNVYQQVLFMAFISVGVIGLVVFWLWFKRRKVWHVADRKLIKLSTKLHKINPQLAKADNEGMLGWLSRLMDSEEMSEQAEELAHIQHYYRRLRYGKLSQIDLQHHDYQTTLLSLNKTVDKVMTQI